MAALVEQLLALLGCFASFLPVSQLGIYPSNNTKLGIHASSPRLDSQVPTFKQQAAHSKPPTAGSVERFLVLPCS